MSDLISREAILKKIEKIRQGAQMMDDIRRASIIMNGMDMCEEAVINQPSAQPVRQTAEWVYGEKDGADGWYCSKCKFHIPWYYDYYGLNNINFIRDFHTCPHCDAKMVKYMDAVAGTV